MQVLVVVIAQIGRAHLRFLQQHKQMQNSAYLLVNALVERRINEEWYGRMVVWLLRSNIPATECGMTREVIQQFQMQASAPLI